MSKGPVRGTVGQGGQGDHGHGRLAGSSQDTGRAGATPGGQAADAAARPPADAYRRMAERSAAGRRARRVAARLPGAAGPGGAAPCPGPCAAHRHADLVPAGLAGVVPVAQRLHPLPGDTAEGAHAEPLVVARHPHAQGRVRLSGGLCAGRLRGRVLRRRGGGVRPAGQLAGRHPAVHVRPSAAPARRDRAALRGAGAAHRLDPGRARGRPDPRGDWPGRRRRDLPVADRHQPDLRTDHPRCAGPLRRARRLADAAAPGARRRGRRPAAPAARDTALGAAAQ